MTKVVEEKSPVATSTKIINAKAITIIPNSRAEHSVYTYSTKVDTHFDIKTKGFFNPAYTFLTVGDIIRIFRFEQEELATYYEFVATKVSERDKKVDVALLFEKNIKKSTIGE